MKSCSALRPYLAALLILVAAGFALRLAAAWNINQVLPDTADRLVGDEWSYDLLARELLQGTFSTQAGRTPIYPLFLAFCYSAFGDSFARALYVQTLISVMAVPLTFRLARYFTDVPSSVIAASLVAFHPVLIRQAENIYTEAFYTPLLALIVLTIVWATRSPQIHRFLATGALLGILNLTRPTGIFLPALLPLIVPDAWSWRRRVGLSGVAVVAMLVIIAPWTYHNYQVHHTFLLLSVTSYALWQASPEYYHLMESGYNFWDVLYSHIFPVYYEGYDPYTIEGSRYFNERAFISIQSEPFVFLWFAVQKLLFFWIGHPMYPWDWPFNLAAVQNHWETEW